MEIEIFLMNAELFTISLCQAITLALGIGIGFNLIEFLTARA